MRGRFSLSEKSDRIEFIADFLCNILWTFLVVFSFRLNSVSTQRFSTM